MTDQPTPISFTPAKLKQLRAAHKKAVEDGLETLTFEGVELFVPYAGYLIEHLTNVFEKQPPIYKHSPN